LTPVLTGGVSAAPAGGVLPTLADLLERTVGLGGSDLHLTIGTPPRVRVDGVLQALELPTLTASEMRPLACSLLTPPQMVRFDETGELDCAFGLGTLARVRCNLFTQRGALAAVYRVIPQHVRSCADLGVPPAVEAFARRPHGLVLVTGATGSGKSTTIAALIDLINTERQGHILTIEDPIEYMHPHKGCLVNQREIHSDTRSFAAALRAALREDPDVVLIGEMRDLETIEAALRIAETGHLTFGTLHTSSAAQTITRVIDVFPAHQQPQVRTQLSLVLEGVVCQALLPRIGGGRVAALEILVPTTAIRNLIREDKVHQIYSAMQTGQERVGMQTANQSLARLHAAGQIRREAAMHASSRRDELQDMLARHGGAALRV
jgi:twitching motility protein PilT